jgi:O-antigen/teichoic acid export membrane protein
MASRSNLLLMLLLGPAILVPAYAAHLYLGREFAGMLGALVCLLPGTIATSVGYVVHSDLAARGAVGRSFISNMVSLAANIGLNVVLIPRYGIVGAAIASSLAYLLNALIACGFFAAIHGLPLRELFIVRGSDVGAIRDRLRQFVGGLVAFK